MTATIGHPHERPQYLSLVMLGADKKHFLPLTRPLSRDLDQSVGNQIVPFILRALSRDARLCGYMYRISQHRLFVGDPLACIEPEVGQYVKSLKDLERALRIARKGGPIENVAVIEERIRIGEEHADSRRVGFCKYCEALMLAKTTPAIFLQCPLQYLLGGHGMKAVETFFMRASMFSATGNA